MQQIDRLFSKLVKAPDTLAYFVMRTLRNVSYYRLMDPKYLGFTLVELSLRLAMPRLLKMLVVL